MEGGGAACRAETELGVSIAAPAAGSRIDTHCCWRRRRRLWTWYDDGQPLLLQSVAHHKPMHALENVGNGVLCRPLGRVNLWQGRRSRAWVLELEVERGRGRCCPLWWVRWCFVAVAAAATASCSAPSGCTGGRASRSAARGKESRSGIRRAATQTTRSDERRRQPRELHVCYAALCCAHF